MDRFPDRPAADALPGVELPPFGRFNGLQVHFAEELVRSHPLGSEVDVRELAVKSLPLLDVARQHFRGSFPDVLAAIMRVAATDRRMGAAPPGTDPEGAELLLRHGRVGRPHLAGRPNFTIHSDRPGRRSWHRRSPRLIPKCLDARWPIRSSRSTDIGGLRRMVERVPDHHGVVPAGPPGPLLGLHFPPAFRLADAGLACGASSMTMSISTRCIPSSS